MNNAAPNNIQVQDTLAGEEVVINALVMPSDAAREDRLTVVTVGIADKRAVIRTGKFSSLARLVDEAWAEFAQVNIGAVGSIETGVLASAELDEEAAAEDGEVLNATAKSAVAFSYREEDF